MGDEVGVDRFVQRWLAFAAGEIERFAGFAKDGGVGSDGGDWVHVVPGRFAVDDGGAKDRQAPGGAALLLFAQVVFLEEVEVRMVAARLAFAERDFRPLRADRRMMEI